MDEKDGRGTPPLQNRYSDTLDLESKGHIGKLAFLLAAVLIFLATIALVFTGFIASKEADRQALFNQEKLLGIALESRFALVARDQLSLARWDRSVAKISLNFDPVFVTDEFVDSLWYDFGLTHNLLIGPDNTILAESFKDEVRFSTGELGPGDGLFTLVADARDSYFAHRTTIIGGYAKKRADNNSLSEATYGFLMHRGLVVMACAMPIVPDDGTYALAEGNPVILLSTLPLEPTLITDLNDQLSFSNLHFNTKKESQPDQFIHPVNAIAGDQLGFFTWSSEMPGQQIWRTVIPLIVVLGSLLGAVAFTIARKIGNLTFSLTASEQRNYYLAMHDTLSGLANRLKVTRVLESTVENSGEAPFTLIQCDLDKFKNVNDTLGHAAGDTVIKTVADRLTRAVGEVGLVGRIGGDEFVILLPDCADTLFVKQLAEKIIFEVQKPIDTDTGEAAKIGISLGVACAPVDGTSSTSLLAAADAALYEAKDTGRNRVVFADSVKNGAE